MNYLFIDSTYDFYLGILNENLEWVSFEKFTDQKASAIIQRKIYDVLEKNSIQIKSLAGVICVNGPGFYTGLRLAEGLSDVFSFFGIPNNSFYSYEVPLWCGYEEGSWFTKAYRGEYFFNHWDKASSQNELIDSKKVLNSLEGKNCFIHSLASLDSLTTPLLQNSVQTIDLIRHHPDKIFPHVIEKKQVEPFYFRAPEDEFKVNP